MIEHEPNRPLTPEQLEQLAKLAAMRDEDIDLSDVPELTEEQLSRGFRPGLHRPIKMPVTIRLDADVVGWFKEHAGDKPYQTEINRVLRQHVAKHEKKRA
ncbi:MAG: BrnA antitoxin family protein [Caulobacter sp.]|nr:BrnA antitoxin family protein [Caulobacter sp.]